MNRVASVAPRGWIRRCLEAGALTAGVLAFLPTPLGASPLGSSAAKPARASLRAGDPAPAFKAGRWVKGGPVTQLQPGQVYVVEFWATWCGPCKAAIPHLTALAKAYAGKVTFIGVDVWESPKESPRIEARVDAFVAQKGAGMDYNVCRDSKDQHMGKAWMTASGNDGIPTAFVVDAKGRIAWIGGPEGLDDVLTGVVAGSFDPAAYEEARRTDGRRVDAIGARLRAKDWSQVLALADSFQSRFQDFRRIVDQWKFRALLFVDLDRAGKEFDRRMVAGGSLAEEAGPLVLDRPGLPKAWFERLAAFYHAQSAAFPEEFKEEARARFLAGDSAGAAIAQARLLDWLVPLIEEEKKDAPQARKQLDQEVRDERRILKTYQMARRAS
jgi:thiol-disulfide isomerase/thioredoxin